MTISRYELEEARKLVEDFAAVDIPSALFMIRGCMGGVDDDGQGTSHDSGDTGGNSGSR